MKDVGSLNIALKYLC